MYVKVRILLISIFFALPLGSCWDNRTPNPEISIPAILSTATPQSDPDKEEYAVYGALFDNIIGNKNTKQILIMKHTRVNNPDLLQQDLSNLQEHVPLASKLVASFLERNQQPHPLKPELDLRLEYQLLTQEEVDKFRLLDEASDLQLFYQKYPETVGYIHLSRVGFNEDLSQALVYYDQYHYEQPIKGGYYLFARRDGRWEFVESMDWIT